MKKQQTTHGALRARTRAFLCAVTLAVLCITQPANAQIWGTEATRSVSTPQLSATNSAVTVTAAADPGDASKQRVVITYEESNDKIWITLIVDAAVNINNSFENIPLGTYQVNSSGNIGTALASEGLTSADYASADIIGTGARRYSGSTYYWCHSREAITNKPSYVTIGVDYTETPHRVMYFTCTSFKSEELTTYCNLSLRVCYTGNVKDYTYCQSDPVICGHGSAEYRYSTASWRRLGRSDSYITATPDDGYTFHHWEDGNGNILGTELQYDFWGWGPESIKAVFSDCDELTPATPTYEVAATVSPAGAGSVTGTGTYDENTDVTLTATPTNRRYVFSHWTDGGSSAGTEGNNVYSINDIATDHNDVVAVFTEVPVTLADNEETSYYTATASTFTGSMDFQLMRTFYAGMWNTVCFPFDLTASQITASEMSGATFYTLSSVTGDAAEGLDFNVSEVTSLSARTPYLVRFDGENIVNPVFEGVTLAASAFTNNTTGTNVGDTRFFGTVHPTALETGESSGFLFLGQNNQLYWPNVANDIRAFRAYFYSGNSTVQAVHPRVRLVVRPETPTDVIEGYNADTWSAVVPARKVLDNGNLIIERDGIRYNAVGQKVN